MSAKSVKVFGILAMVALMLLPATLLVGADSHEGDGTTKIGPGEQQWYTLSVSGDGEVQVSMNVDPDGGATFLIVTQDAGRAYAAGEDLEVTGRGTESDFDDADLSWTGSFGGAGDHHLIVEYTGSGKEAAYSLEVSGASISADVVGEEKDAAAAEEADAEAAEVQTAATELAKATAVSRLSNQAGRAIVTARGNHFVVDSVPPLGGPNEEINPLDLLLGAQATCAAFVYETAAIEKGFEVSDISATVEGDLNTQGLKDGSVNPRIQAMRVHMDLGGASEAQAAELAEEFKARCPMYTTLIRSMPIEITTGEKQKASVAEGLATASAVAKVSNQPGRAIVTARGNHFVVDSVPPLGGPNEERNPLDLALGALATCGTFIYETAAEEMDIPLTDISAKVEASFDARGVKDGSVNPRIQEFNVEMTVAGATEEQAAKLAEEFKVRCPIYTTLSRSAPIEIVNAIQ